MGNYIKLYRKMTEWEWYDHGPTKDVFLHLLLTANYEAKSYRGIALARGECIVTQPELSTELGLTIQQVRTAISHLISTGEITERKEGKSVVFTIKNYSDYQDINMKNNSMSTEHQQATNRTSTGLYNTKKERSEEYKEKDTPKGVSKKKVAEKATYGEFGNVKLTGEEHEKLVDSLGDKGAEDYIERLSAYLAQSGKPYKSHYATILNWWRKDGQPVNRSPAPMSAILPDEGRDISGLTPKEIFGGG